MARYRPVYVQIWDDPIFRSYSADGKVLFFYMITNERCSESGIYKLPIHRAAYDTGIPEQEVSSIITDELQGNLETLDGNVFYDWDTDIVFVKNFYKYNGRGSPIKLQKSLQSDYNVFDTILWDAFSRVYQSLSKDIIRNRDSLRDRDSNRNVDESEYCLVCGEKRDDTGLCPKCDPVPF